MKNYTFHITETRETTLTVKANDIRDAETIAHLYHDCFFDDPETIEDEVEVTVKMYGYCDEEERACDYD